MNGRRMPLVLAFAAMLILGSLGWLVSLSKTSQAAPAPSSDAAFKGKVLFVYAAASMMPNVFILEKAQLQKMGDRSCLVGKGVADGPLLGWHKGRTVWLPMEHIVSITEFDTVKDAKKALESSAVTIEAAPAIAPVPAGVPAVAPAPAVPAPPPMDRPAKR